MQPLVSVIVPVYNVEKFLDKCLTSIVNQSYKNLQVLLVDDGSTDASTQICDKYADIDARVSVYHNSNHGPSYSRNVGIEHSRGEYIAFVDSDDWIDEEYVASLVQSIVKTSSELVISPFYFDYPDYPEKTVVQSVNERQLTGSLKHDFVILYDLVLGPCCKLYRKDIICRNNIDFPLGRTYAEDRVFNYAYLMHIKTYIYIDVPQYHYRQFEGPSLVKQRTMKAFDDALYALGKENEFLQAVDAEKKHEMLYWSVNGSIFHFWQTHETGAGYVEFCRRFSRIKALVPVAYSFRKTKSAVASCAYFFNLPCVYYAWARLKACIKGVV